DSLVFQMEKMVSENRDKLEESTRAEVERGIEAAKKVLEDNKEAKEAAPFKSAFEDLQKASYKMAEQMYKSAGPAAAGPGEAPPTPDSTQAQKDVIDADVEEHR